MNRKWQELSSSCSPRLQADEPMSEKRRSPVATIVETWFARYRGELNRFLRRHLRDEREVEDCAQETFLRVWRQEERGLLNGETQGLLFTTALNVVRDRHRRRLVRSADEHDELDEELLSGTSGDAERQLHWAQALRELERSLAELRASTRSVFLLYHLEHLSYPEIAQRLGVTTRTVEREMARALSHCASSVRPFLENP